MLADKFRQQGKPEAMIEKIVENGLKTFYKEQTFLEQPFIFDDSGKKSVAQAVKEAEGKVGGPIKITGFVRYGLGEGIEKAEKAILLLELPRRLVSRTNASAHGQSMRIKS